MPSAVTILKRLQQEQMSEAQVINLKIIMKNIYAYSETVSKILSLSFDTVLQLLERCKSSLGKEKLFNQLFAMTMKAKGQVAWFEPNDEGAAYTRGKTLRSLQGLSLCNLLQQIMLLYLIWKLYQSPFI